MSPSEPVADRAPGTPADEVGMTGEAGRLAPVAARLGWTEGQLYSAAVSLTLACLLVISGRVPLGGSPTLSALPAEAPTSVPPSAPAVRVPVPALPPAAPSAPLALGGLADPASPAGGPELQPALSGPAAPATVATADPGFQIATPGFPRALAADATSVFAGTDDTGPAASQIVGYSHVGQQTQRVAIKGQGRQRTGGLTSAAIYGSGLLATDRGRGALLWIDPRSGDQKTLATLPDLPPCLSGLTGTCQPGVENAPPTPEGVVAAGGFAYIADAGQGTIWRYEFAGKKLTAWYASTDFASSGPSGLALDDAGDLVFTVAQTLDTAAFLKGAVYRLAVSASGAPDTRTLVAAFDAGVDPGPVAVGYGATYVGLRGAGGIVEIAHDGKVTSIPTATSAVLPKPSGLALVEGLLFVVDQGKSPSASTGRLVALPVADRPANQG